jgi:hypothetical protein
MGAELLERDRSLDHAESESAARLGHAQREHSELGHGAPIRPVDRAALAFPDPRRGEALLAEPPHGFRELSLRFVQAKIHRRPDPCPLKTSIC